MSFHFGLFSKNDPTAIAKIENLYEEIVNLNRQLKHLTKEFLTPDKSKELNLDEEELAKRKVEIPIAKEVTDNFREKMIEEQEVLQKLIKNYVDKGGKLPPETNKKINEINDAVNNIKNIQDLAQTPSLILQDKP